MYEEYQNNFSAPELMHYTSTHSTTTTTTTDSSSPDYINNNLDFNIYSEPSTLTTDFIENELYDPIHQIGPQTLVNQQESSSSSSSINVTENILPLNYHSNQIDHILHYTNLQNQSNLIAASPHGYSENHISTPLLAPLNSTPILPHLTPILTDNNQLLFSPIDTSTSFGDLILFDDTNRSDLGTPYTSPLPLITPTTPFSTPYVTSNSPFSEVSSTINTPFFPTTSLLETPVVANSDPELFDNFDPSSKWYNLFGSPANVITNSDPVDLTTYKRPYNNNNNIYVTIRSMDSIPPTKVEHSTPKSLQSEASTPNLSDKNVSLAESPINSTENSIAISVSETVETNNVIDNSTIIESFKTEGTNTQTVDSIPTTPVDNTRLVPIKPRPTDEEELGENESNRRSKRQRTMSISEENDDDNDDEVEKKYNCPECGRGFNRKFNMQTHRSTHDPNRVKPFACEHPNCGSRFTRKHDLKRHINGIHKGEKVHECNVCRKPFSRKDAWKRHIATCGKV